MLPAPDLQRSAPPDHEDFSCWRPLDGCRLALVLAVAPSGDSPLAESRLGRLGAREARVAVVPSLSDL